MWSISQKLPWILNALYCTTGTQFRWHMISTYQHWVSYLVSDFIWPMGGDITRITNFENCAPLAKICAFWVCYMLTMFFCWCCFNHLFNVSFNLHTLILNIYEQNTSKKCCNTVPYQSIYKIIIFSVQTFAKQKLLAVLIEVRLKMNLWM